LQAGTIRNTFKLQLFDMQNIYFMKLNIAIIAIFNFKNFPKTTMTIGKDAVIRCYKQFKETGKNDELVCLLCNEEHKPIKQRKGSGHTNLRCHLLSCNPNHFTNDATSSLLDFIRQKCTKIYGWMKKIVYNCKPLNIVDNVVDASSLHSNQSVKTHCEQQY
jgi:hypothetical protein